MTCSIWCHKIQHPKSKLLPTPEVAPTHASAIIHVYTKSTNWKVKYAPNPFIKQKITTPHPQTTNVYFNIIVDFGLPNLN